MEIQVKVPASETSGYKVRIGRGLLGEVLSETCRMLPGRRVFVVTDENVRSAGHLDALLAGAQAGVYVVAPAGEQSKTIATVIDMVETMEKASLGRDTVVVALGGGTVGDMAGFAAAFFKRGVPVVQVPTTTVAQADSAIGGKTGVDSSLSKNAFGVFHHPAAVFIDVDTLASLDERQYRSGLVESIKHALIADAAYFDYIEKNLDHLLSRQADALVELAVWNTRIKASVVEQDPQERNLRRVLNYGHTVGHAVESASRYELLHGEAVAVGIVAAGMIETAMGLGRSQRLERIRPLLAMLGMPTSIAAGVDKAEVMDLLARDKKAAGGWPRFVLLEEIGRVHCSHGQWAVDVPRQLVEKTIDVLSSK